MVIATMVFAQKKEVSSAFKAIENNDIATATAQLNAADSQLQGNIHLLDPELQEQYYYAKGLVALKQGKGSEGALLLSKISELGKSKIYTGKDANKNRVYFVGKSVADASGISGLKEESFTPKTTEKLINIVNPLLNKVNTEAVEAYNAKKYGEAGKKFEETYYLLLALGQENGQLLYNAGLSYISGGQKDKAIAAFKKLIDNKYTGVETIYKAKEKKTGKVVTLEKETWEMFKKTQDYTDFTKEVTPSIEPELYETYATLLIEEGKNDEAIAFLSTAIAKFPTHAKFSELQGLAYHKAGKTSEFVSSLRATLQKNPNDANAWYNLGVMLSNEPAKYEEAKEAYNKAIALNPNMEVAYQNLGNLIIGDDQKAIDEYNALRKAGKSAEANKIIEARRERFRQALPIFEKWYNVNPNSFDAVSMLKGLYQSTQNEAKYKEFKAKEEALKSK